MTGRSGSSSVCCTDCPAPTPIAVLRRGRRAASPCDRRCAETSRTRAAGLEPNILPAGHWISSRPDIRADGRRRLLPAQVSTPPRRRRTLAAWRRCRRSRNAAPACCRSTRTAASGRRAVCPPRRRRRKARIAAVTERRADPGTLRFLPHTPRQRPPRLSEAPNARRFS